MGICCDANAKKVVLHFQEKQRLCRQVFSRNQLEMPIGVETIITVSCWRSLSAKIKWSG